MVNSILRLPAVKKSTGLSRSTIYAKLSKREFPAPVVLGPRCVGWLESEVQAWIAERVKLSRPEGAK